MARALGTLMLLLCSGVGLCQQQLVVNGQPVPGFSTAIVASGESYAPAQALADSLGARYAYDATAGAALFEWAARLLSVRVYGGAAEASADAFALELEGERLSGKGGVLVGDEVYVPVRPIVTALGGAVSYLESRQTVMAVFPRARVRSAEVTQGGRRLVVEIEGLTAASSFFNRALNTLQTRFERTDLLAPQSFSGLGFSRAVLAPTAGYTELRLTLEPGYTYETFATPSPQGFSLVVDIVPEDAERAEELSALRLVIDPGHGGGDPGLSFSGRSEAALTLDFARHLAASLSERGYQVSLTRDGDADVPLTARSQQGIGSSLFLSLHADGLRAGRYRLYYLGDLREPASLNLILRENALAAAAAETDALRRRILLGLVPELPLGERYARRFSSELSQQAEVQAESLLAAPLAVLEGAAGRGLLLELSPADLASETLPEAVAAAIVAVLEEAGD